ncbi:solute symporter family transporter [Gloeophyllum trabeum ATCC 11539]|uniref:Solute symporter family transporter n=1 Tax=Gloeophyllum trabeum (strain ATCC 11539 / FP-39264 / Madison 617) TaxID=670483 RepID=S7RY43_GLOTA|nr:solute symporter family transporter [Gloeophyllum trabeum ATCC 11539]EPQ58324.1 solute symporter family transporter [Gloeophyllum trabeum ATCC 11539]
MSEVTAILPQGVGYGVVLGVGFFFAGFMAILTQIQNRYTQYSTKTSEEFNTASRSVKPGLIASGIVSAWTWAATLLQSCTVAYEYGISGPFWYASGATVQILLFAILGVKVKQNAPRCHTYLEIIYTRYGSTAHWVFMVFAFITNILVGSQLLLGGSAVVTALTGMNVYAAVWLIPVGVTIYVILGGLRATFLCDYTHTFILMIIYSSSPLIGSPREMYNLLKIAAAKRPVAGNTDGSYMTLKSNFALIFGVIQLCSGSGTVFLDQGYWQRAIASRPSTAVRAYLLGGLAWYAIPFAFATTLGLAAVALTDHPSFPTYPNPLSASQVSAGLAAPTAAVALLGKGGAAALLIILFMAVTSAASSEMIATSSILTFDVYKLHIRPDAPPATMIQVSHIMIVVFAFVMATMASVWQAIGIDLGWLFLFMGVIIGGAVVPVALTICWKKQTKVAAITGAIVGCASGILAWLLTAAYTNDGVLSVATTGQEYASVAGSLASICMGAICTVGISLWNPDDFDWEITRAINRVPEQGASSSSSTVDEEDRERQLKEKERGDVQIREAKVQGVDDAPLPGVRFSEDEHPDKLKSALKFAIIASFGLVAVMDLIVPLPLFFSHYTFSVKFFTAWVVIGIIWAFCSAFICIFLPLMESRNALSEVGGGLIKDIFTGGRHHKRRREAEQSTKPVA